MFTVVARLADVRRASRRRSRRRRCLCDVTGIVWPNSDRLHVRHPHNTHSFHHVIFTHCRFVEWVWLLTYILTYLRLIVLHIILHLGIIWGYTLWSLFQLFINWREFYFLVTQFFHFVIYTLLLIPLPFAPLEIKS